MLYGHKHPGFCEYHGDVETRENCSRCQVFICPDCQRKVGDEVYCPVCYNLPHIKALERRIKGVPFVPIWLNFLLTVALAIGIAIFYGRYNAANENKTFFLTFFMGAAVGIFTGFVAGETRSGILRLISVVCGAIAVFLGDFLYFRTSRGMAYLSPGEYLQMAGNHTNLEWASMLLGVLNAYLITAPKGKLRLKGKKKSPAVTLPPGAPPPGPLPPGAPPPAR